MNIIKFSNCYVEKFTKKEINIETLKGHFINLFDLIKGFSLDLHLTPSDYLVTCNFTTSLLYNSLYSNDSNDENFSKILNFLNSKVHTTQKPHQSFELEAKCFVDNGPLFCDNDENKYFFTYMCILLLLKLHLSNHHQQCYSISQQLLKLKIKKTKKLPKYLLLPIIFTPSPNMSLLDQTISILSSISNFHLSKTFFSTKPFQCIHYQAFITYIKGLFYYLNCQFEKCLETLQKLLSSSHNSVHPHLLNNIYLLFALSFNAKGKHQLALQMLKSAMQLPIISENNDVSKQHLGVFILLTCIQFEKMQHKSAHLKALESLKEISQQTEHLSGISFWNFFNDIFVTQIFKASTFLINKKIADVHFSDGNYNDCIDLYKRLISSPLNTGLSHHENSKHLQPFQLLLNSYFGCGVYENCIQWCNQALHSYPFHNILNDELFDEKNHDLKYMQDDFESYIFHCEIGNMLSKVYIKIDKIPEASQIISKTILKLEWLGIKMQSNVEAIKQVDKTLSDLYTMKADCMLKDVQIDKKASPLLLHYLRLSYQLDPNNLEKLEKFEKQIKAETIKPPGFPKYNADFNK